MYPNVYIYLQKTKPVLLGVTSPRALGNPGTGENLGPD